MPTTKLKNMAYRFMLPFFAPSCGAHPVVSVTGHTLSCRKNFEKLLHRHHVLGSAVMLKSENGHTLICTSSKTPPHTACAGTFFRVASITKTAAAILSMKLVEQQIIDPDRPVGAYLFPSGPDSVLNGITLKHLLSHTSGLVDPPGLESCLEKGIPFTDFIADARHDTPGASFHYSNLGFGLIGSLMEAVLDKPVGQIFREYLFDPLEMNATLEGCLLPYGSIMPVTRILPYRKDRDLILTALGSRPLLSPDPLRHYGHTAGSMYTDVISLQKLFDILIHNRHRFLTDHSVHEMCLRHASYGSISPSLSYGYGLLRIQDPSVSESTVLGHQGFAYGCADGAFWEENTGNSVIMLNGGSSEARTGRLGLLNRDLMIWAFRKELPSWSL